MTTPTDAGMVGRRVKASMQDHLHPAMTAALEAASALNRVNMYIPMLGLGRATRQSLEMAREYARDMLTELDAFEAAVWPALASGLSENVSEAAE